MPTPDSDNTKIVLREYVRRLLGEATQPVGHRPDWLISKDGSTSVFITFSASDNLFFDVGHTDLFRWSDYRKAFIVFVLGDRRKTLVIPVEMLRQQLHQAQRVPSERYGDYKLHLIAESGRCFFREVPDWDLNEFSNNYFPLLCVSEA